MKTFKEYMQWLNEASEDEAHVLSRLIVRFLRRRLATPTPLSGKSFEAEIFKDLEFFLKKSYARTRKMVVHEGGHPAFSIKSAKDTGVITVGNENLYDPSCLYILSQPNGERNSPDLALVLNHKALEIELKSSKKGTIMWNSGVPTPHRIYIYNYYCHDFGKNGTEVKYPETIVFMGKSRLEVEEYDLTILMDELVKEVDVFVKKQMQSEQFKPLVDNKIKFYPRKLWTDKLNYKKNKMASWMSDVADFVYSFKWG